MPPEKEKFLRAYWDKLCRESEQRMAEYNARKAREKAALSEAGGSKENGREKKIHEYNGIITQPAPHEDSPFLSFGLDGTVEPDRDIVPVLRIQDPNGNDPKERYTVNDVRDLTRRLSSGELSGAYLMGAATYMSRKPPKGSHAKPATKFRDKNIKNIEKFLIKVRDVWEWNYRSGTWRKRQANMNDLLNLADKADKHGLMPHAIEPSLDRKGRQDGWWICYNFTRPVSGRPWSNVLIYRMMYYIFQNLPFMKGMDRGCGTKFYVEIPSRISNFWFQFPVLKTPPDRRSSRVISQRYTTRRHRQR